jgi:hypothetical protein
MRRSFRPQVVVGSAGTRTGTSRFSSLPLERKMSTEQVVAAAHQICSPLRRPCRPVRELSRSRHVCAGGGGRRPSAAGPCQQDNAAVTNAERLDVGCEFAADGGRCGSLLRLLVLVEDGSVNAECAVVAQPEGRQVAAPDCSVDGGDVDAELVRGTGRIAFGLHGRRRASPRRQSLRSGSAPHGGQRCDGKRARACRASTWTKSPRSARSSPP